MKKIQHENIRSISVKQDALNDIYAHFDAFHKSTVFQEECRSWFKDGKATGRILLWPGCVSGSSLTHSHTLLSYHALTVLPLIRPSISSSQSKTLDSKITTSSTGTTIVLRIWVTARSERTSPKTSKGCRRMFAIPIQSGTWIKKQIYNTAQHVTSWI